MNNKQDFTQGSIFNKLITFMIPILGALILQAMYGAVDLLIVGRFGTTAGISGVSTGSSIMNLVTFVVIALVTGVTVLLGRYLGAKENELIGPLLGNSISFFALISILLSVVLVLFARPIAILMQAPEQAIDLTATYIRICGTGFIFVVFYNFIGSIFKGLGNSTLPLLFVAIACVVNIVGDLVLVAGFHLNVVGAALATVGAQAVSVILSIIVILKMDLPFSIHKKDFKLGRPTLQFLKIGIPLALQEALTNITFLALCAFVNKLGLDASSGYGIAQKIQSFVMLIPSSLMQCITPFVAQNVGAGKEERAQQGLFTGMGIGVSIGIVMAIVIFIKGDLVSSLFTTDEAVVIRSFEYLKGFAPEAVVTSVLFSFLSYYNGHSKSVFVMAQGLIQSFLVRLPMSYIMSIQPNASLTYIGLAAPTATTFGIILCFIYFFHLKKKNEL